MNLKICFSLVFFLFAASVALGQLGGLYAGEDVAEKFPTPPKNDKMLFYLQRTHNTNTIVYSVRTNSKNVLDADDPIHVYWIRYADNGEIKELSFIQEKFAYGYSSKLIDKTKQLYEIRLKAYDKKILYLEYNKEKRSYEVYCTIKGKKAILHRVFVKVDGGSFWSPNVVYIELKGVEVGSGKGIIERFRPKG